MKANGQVQAVNPLVEALRSQKSDSPEGLGKLLELPLMKDGLSAEELALASGVSVKTLRERLKGLLAEGRLTVGRKQAMSLIGRSVWVPCYKIKP